MRNITKTFPGIKANDNITLQLRRGEIHALLGENGAGKSTLMSVLFGLYQPDSGEIYKDGQKVNIRNPNDANALGIGMVHQHFKLVEVFSVLDNIILGAEDTKMGILNKKEARKKVISLSEKYGLRVDPDGIHIMVSEDATNIFPVDINRNFRLEYNGVTIETSVTGIIRGSRRLEDGTLVDVHGDVINLDRVRIIAAIRPEDIEMTDEQDVGLVQGNISNLIYLGDHYSYVVHTDHDQDFVVNDEDLWNMGDRVSLLMPVEKMKFTYSRKK
jgi:ABC-type sugar transport system ATPase subunit